MAGISSKTQMILGIVGVEPGPMKAALIMLDTDTRCSGCGLSAHPDHAVHDAPSGAWHASALRYCEREFVAITTLNAHPEIVAGVKARRPDLRFAELTEAQALYLAG